MISRRELVQRRRAVILGIAAGVVVAALLMVLVVRFASQNPDDVALGDPTFDAGRVERMAETVERGGPVLYPDLLRRGRNVYVNHVGDSPATGWVAFAASAPGADPERCQLRWQPDETVFEDPCSGREYPADGEGLPSYEVTVEDGRIVVDLRTARGAAR